MLYYIATGASVPGDINEDILGFLEKGQELYANCTAESSSDQARFEKSISRRHIKNFAGAAVKKTITTKYQNVVELHGTRNLLGRLLYNSALENIDIGNYLRIHLLQSPLPWHMSMTHQQTDKSKLLYKFEEMVERNKPGDIDATLVNAMFLLLTLVNLTLTLGGVAEVIIRQLCDMSKYTDLVCDTYVVPSIKGAERSGRGSKEKTYAMTGPEQKRPHNWQTARQSESFKTGLFRFLAPEWKNDR